MYRSVAQGRDQKGEQILGVITMETTFRSMSLDQIPKRVSLGGKEGRSKV